MSHPSTSTAALTAAPAAAPMPRLAYRPIEFAEATGLGLSTVQNMLTDGVLPARKFRDATLILADEAVAALKTLRRAEYQRMKAPTTQT